jgi:hypothetical protein
MKAEMLSFVFNNFSESRLFNGLLAIQRKKFPAFVFRPGHAGNAYLCARLHAAGHAYDQPR